MSLKYDIHEKPKSNLMLFLLSIQHVFAMFASTITVAALSGLDSSTALISSGLGTLAYTVVTRGKVPVFLGSSFAFTSAMATYTLTGAPDSAYTGLFVVAAIYIFISLVISVVGKEWIKYVFPAVIVGPTIMVIGLELSSTAIVNSGFISPESWKQPLIAAVTLFTTILFAIFGKGFTKLTPFLIGVAAGYLTGLALGEVYIDFDSGVKVFALPTFNLFIVDWNLDFSSAILFAPLAFVTITEHIGDHTVLGSITNKNFLVEPGLDKTLMGDGIATGISALIGGPGNTTYAENTALVYSTGVASIWVTTLAAIMAIILGFTYPLQVILGSIPLAVIGGVSVYLFALIAANGLKIISDDVDVKDIKNSTIISIMLIIGVGGALFSGTSSYVSGMSLSLGAGLLTYLSFIIFDKCFKNSGPKNEDTDTK